MDCHANATMSKPPTRFPQITPDTKAARLKRLRVFSRLLDKAIPIPGTNVGIGLDPILGLLPAGGDFLGILLAGYIVIEAARLGASQTTLGKMFINIAIDALVGVIPVFGDIFDIAWTANERNIKLLEEQLQFPHQRKKADSWFVFVILAGLLILAVGVATFVIIVLNLLWGTLTGS